MPQTFLSGDVRKKRHEEETETFGEDETMVRSRGKGVSSSRRLFFFVVAWVVFALVLLGSTSAPTRAEEISILTRRQKDDETDDGKDFERKTATTTRARWVFERSGSVKLNASTTSSSSSSRSVALRDVVGLRYLGKRALEMVREDGSFVKMSLVFSRRKEREKRTTRRSLESVEEKGEMGILFGNGIDGGMKASATTFDSGNRYGVFALREDGELLRYENEESQMSFVYNMSRPFRERVNARCAKSHEVFTIFRANKDVLEHGKAELCAMCSETRRAGGRAIYNGFCIELNEDDTVAPDGDVSSFSYIVSREYQPVAFQGVDDYVIALERHRKNENAFRLQMFSSKAILVSSKLKSPIEPILAYSSSKDGKEEGDNEFKFLCLAYSKFNDDDDIAPNAIPNTLGIFAIGVPMQTTSNQTDIVLRMFNARTEDISTALAGARVTMKHAWILFVVLVTILTCSMLTLCAASTFVGMPKPFEEEVAEDKPVVVGDIEEHLLVSVEDGDDGDDDDEKEEEEEEEEEVDGNGNGNASEDEVVVEEKIDDSIRREFSSRAVLKAEGKKEEEEEEEEEEEGKGDVENAKKAKSAKK